jgi:predicted SnoaL-like aldol condensation-catalyzing enzyme
VRIIARMTQTALRNKEIVREIIEKVVNGGDADLAARYYKADYIQHNPNVAQGLDGLQELIRAMHSSPNPPRAEIKLINAEDDMVWLLLEWSGGDMPEGLPRISKTAEVFRVEDGMMAEHWDVLELAPD